MEILDYYSIRESVKRIGRENEVRLRAKELQRQLAEPETDVPFKDAYEMAYYEFRDRYIR